MVFDSVLGLTDSVPVKFVANNDEKRKVQKHLDLLLVRSKFSETFESSEFLVIYYGIFKLACRVYFDDNTSRIEFLLVCA